jgi:CBS-domain-containing membrane protein
MLSPKQAGLAGATPTGRGNDGRSVSCSFPFIAARRFLGKVQRRRRGSASNTAFQIGRLAGAGGFFAISCLVWLTSFSSTPLILGSFGATCVLIFGFPDAPFSQPRNVVVGHVLSSLIGVTALTLFGPHWWAGGIAAGAAIAAMMATRTVHPPAGSNPVIVFMSQPGWAFVIYPTLVGALLLVALALVFNNSTRKTTYPIYW